MMKTTYRFTISMKAWVSAIQGSGVPEEEGWVGPVGFRNRGSGQEVVYEVDAIQADLMETHLRMLGETWVSCGVEGAADGRACLVAADRIAKVMAS